MVVKKTVTVAAILFLAVLLAGCGILSSDPISNSRAQISSVSPGTTRAASYLTLKVHGSGFTPDSVVTWNGLAKTTAFITDQLLLASISATDVLQPTDATVTVLDSKAKTQSNSAKVKVVGNLTITSSVLPTALVNASYSASVQSSGGAKPIKWTAVTGLPPGLRLASSGSLTGTPTKTGNFSFVVTATDSSSPAQSVSATLTLAVSGTQATVAPLSQTTSTVPSATQGSAYSIVLPVSGGASPYAWSNAAGLPAGMSLAANGTLSGTPTTMGNYQVTAKVSDSSSPSQSINTSYQLSVASAVAPLIVATTSLPSGQAGTSYSARLSGSGGTTPYTWSATTALPAGLSLATDGTLSGTPSVSGSFSIGVQVKDNSAPQEIASATLPLTLASAPTTPLTITTTSLPGGTVGSSYGATLSASGGSSSYSWSATGLPAGLSISSSGYISGTPTTTGTSTVSLKVVDSTGTSATQSVSLAVGQAPTSGTAPTISNIAVRTTTTTATITWTTNVPSDSVVFYGLDPAFGYTGPYSSAQVTSHSVTLTGLWPGQSYFYAVKSGTSWTPGGPFTMLAAPTSGTYDFYVATEGPHSVTQGYDMYGQIYMGMLSGTRTYVNVTVTGIPAGATLHFPEVEDGTMCCSFSQSTATATIYSPSNMQFEISGSSSTPLGSYTLHLHVTSGAVVKDLDYQMNVNAVSSIPAPTPIASVPPIPSLSLWESNMTTYGAKWCVQQTSPGVSCGIGAENCSWYYDGQRVYYQIADYTGDSSWNTCATNSRTFYRDGYVLAASPAGAISGWRVFPHGLVMDYQRNGDATSRAALDDLSTNSSYARLYGLITARLARETAYQVHLNLFEVDLGAGPTQSMRLTRSVDYALGQIDQWYGSKTAIWIQPFMVGLTMESLIHYYDDGHPDPRVLAAVQMAADGLWNNAWSSTKGSFYYNSFYAANGLTSTSNAADLNLLIAPAYAWLWHKTGDPKYLSEGDQIFSNGVQQASVNWNGKIFSQNYRWSFDYVKWRTNP